MTAEAIASVLGGPGTLKRIIETSDDLVRLTRDGVPGDSIQELAAAMSTDSETIAQVCGLPAGAPPSTGPLSFSASDRAVRLARIFASTMDVFKDPVKAGHWLQSPLRVLEGRTPFDLLDTDTGTRTIENILGRISHGLFS